MIRRQIPGLGETASANDNELPVGFYLVRVDRISYRHDRRHPLFYLRLTVLEPSAFAGSKIDGRLSCTSKALWKLSWFLRDFGYDPERLGLSEVDEREVIDLKGIVHVGYALERGCRVTNLAGFAPAAQWHELSQLLPPTSDLDNEAA